MSLEVISTETLIAGGGPAGLTAGYLLSRRSRNVVVVDAHPTQWGGISRTESYKGYRFDIGGHRFFSKSDAVERLWDEILPEPMLDRPRKSRIFYGGKFYSYPLKPFEALRNLGVAEAIRCVASYAKAKITPINPARSFEDWVVNAFGRRLFEIFFRTYTEKVWGMSCAEISADWAAQRIRGLSLTRAVLHALTPRRPDRAATVKTLIDTFRYPRLGPGMMWQAAADRIADAGGSLLQGHALVGLEWNPARKKWIGTSRDRQGRTVSIEAESVISSIPLRQLTDQLSKAISPAALAAGQSLRYRDFLTVALIVRERGRFDDNWIYVHEAGVRVGRIQNYKSWSPAMVPDHETACYGLEYFCDEGDDLWRRSDEELIGIASAELAQLGLVAPADVLDGTVVRQAKAYPVYDADYATHVETIRKELEVKFPSLHVVGRNGMHKYNNQDHAMMTAMLTVENILAGSREFDVWQVNQDAEYHESGAAGQDRSESGLRSVPRPIRSPTSNAMAES